jgi:hypothetical protein
MRNARNIFLGLFLIFFTVSVGGGLFWANMNFVRRVSVGVDFLVPWKAAQDFMLLGESPYGPFTAFNLQKMILGHPPLPGQYPYLPNMPLYILMLFFPLASIRDLTVAQSIWMVILETAQIGLILVSLRLARWRPHWLFLLFTVLFSIFWAPVVLALLLGNSSILQALLFFGALRALEKGSDELGGTLAALTLVNVETTGLVFILFLIWVFSTQRWRILYGLAMTLVFLVAFSWVLLPGWFLPFLGAVISNWRAGAIPSTFSLFEGWFPGIGLRLSRILAVAALAVIFLEWAAVRKKDVRHLFWTASLTFALAPLLGIPFFPSWLAFTLPGVLLIISVMMQRWGLPGMVSAALVMAGLFFGLWSAQLGAYTSIFLLFYPLVLALLLYWVRWWAVRPLRMWADEIALRG